MAKKSHSLKKNPCRTARVVPGGPTDFQGIQEVGVSIIREVTHGAEDCRGNTNSLRRKPQSSFSDSLKKPSKKADQDEKLRKSHYQHPMTCLINKVTSSSWVVKILEINFKIAQVDTCKKFNFYWFNLSQRQ
ncbi:hypothetical protein CEXT_810611 [Caerostris extrusa]|uniref:Uncharacterized protein n=1 Tax=Caerostris extrusa TaxID=172846 RepID=A0AAV4QNI2_CAEEX|nr:hypothetical protein CEXT_810611 [Caerostris extrusa]